jgi:hypothetical protein
MVQLNSLCSWILWIEESVMTSLLAEKLTALDDLEAYLERGGRPQPGEWPIGLQLQRIICGTSLALTIPTGMTMIRNCWLGACFFEFIGNTDDMEHLREAFAVLRLGLTRLDEAAWNRVLARFMVSSLEMHTDPRFDLVKHLWQDVLAGTPAPKEIWEAVGADSWLISSIYNPAIQRGPDVTVAMRIRREVSPELLEKIVREDFVQCNVSTVAQVFYDRDPNRSTMANYLSSLNSAEFFELSVRMEVDRHFKPYDPKNPQYEEWSRLRHSGRRALEKILFDAIRAEAGVSS